VLDDKLREQIDQILAESGQKAPKRRKDEPGPSLLARNSPADAEVQALIDRALAKSRGPKRPVVEPEPPPRRRPVRVDAEVVCILCSRSPASVTLPLTSRRCFWFGFRGLLLAQHAV
jgi:hypothetical protein